MNHIHHHRLRFEVRDQENVPETVNPFLEVMTLQKTASTRLLDALGYVLHRHWHDSAGLRCVVDGPCWRSSCWAAGW